MVMGHALYAACAVVMEPVFWLLSYCSSSFDSRGPRDCQGCWDLEAFNGNGTCLVCCMYSDDGTSLLVIELLLFQIRFQGSQGLSGIPLMWS